MGMVTKIGKKIRFFDENQLTFRPIARKIAIGPIWRGTPLGASPWHHTPFRSAFVR
jgi:hypothetical protein